MHMADALLAPSVVATMYAVSGIVTGLSVKVVRKITPQNWRPWR